MENKRLDRQLISFYILCGLVILIITAMFVFAIIGVLGYEI